jgi:hypothetical protein
MKAKRPRQKKATAGMPFEPFSLKFRASEYELVELSKKPFDFFKIRLNKPFIIDGKPHLWGVQRFKVTNELEVVNLGIFIHCQTEAEVGEVIKMLSEQWRSHISHQTIPKTEKLPVEPGSTICIHPIINAKQITARFIVTEAALNNAMKRARELWPDLSEAKEEEKAESFVHFGGRVTYQDVRKRFHSEMAMLTEPQTLTIAYRLIRYDKSMEENGHSHSWGVERVELDDARKRFRVIRRRTFISESEAVTCFEQWKTHAAVESKNLLLEQSARDLKSTASSTAEADLEAAREKHFRECWPVTYAVKDKLRNAEGSDKAQLKEELRRAFALDSARLKIPVPADVLAGLDLEPSFLGELAKAWKAADPLDQADREIVLNWLSQYAHQKPVEYAREINQVTGENVSAATLQKRVNAKFRLTSKRPEGRPPKS